MQSHEIYYTFTNFISKYLTMITGLERLEKLPKISNIQLLIIQGCWFGILFDISSLIKTDLGHPTNQMPTENFFCNPKKKFYYP